MPHNKHHILLQDGHPALALLRQYHDDALPPTLSHQVEKHLVGCELCTDVVEGMTLSTAANTEAAVKELNQRVAASIKQERKRQVLPVWQIAAAVLVLLCTSALVLYYNYGNLQREQGSMAVGQQVKSSQPLPVPIPSNTEFINENVADSSVSRSIAAVSSTEKAISQRKRPVINRNDFVIDGVTPQEVMAEMDEKAYEDYTRNIMEGIDAPSLATATPAKIQATESVIATDALRLSVAPTNAPESTTVANALQGRVAGVSVRGMSSLDNNGDNKEISGQVLSEDGQPLPGVSVLVKGTRQATITDYNGNFKLSVNGAKPILLFNYIGFETAEKAVTATTTALNVQMTTDKMALSEVVVVGYGKTTPSDALDVAAAKPVGGRKAFQKYLKENLKIPVGSESERGKVVVGFTVSASGAIRDVQVLKSLCPACDAEAVRLIKQGPSWMPATQAGTPIEQQVKVKVIFRGSTAK